MGGWPWYRSELVDKLPLTLCEVDGDYKGRDSLVTNSHQSDLEVCV